MQSNLKSTSYRRIKISVDEICYTWKPASIKTVCASRLPIITALHRRLSSGYKRAGGKKLDLFRQGKFEKYDWFR